MTEPRVDDLAFAHLHGSLIWTRDRFAVTHADAEMLRWRDALRLLDRPARHGRRLHGDLSADYADMDLAELIGSSNLEEPGARRTRERHLSIEWPNGRFGAAVAGKGTRS